MIIPTERWLLDTNIWVFGLRSTEGVHDCGRLLNQIGSFTVVIPLQVLKELNFNLSEDEIRDFYKLVNQYPEGVELSWQSAPQDRIRFYEGEGCRKGDAVIAAHAEALAVNLIVTENRQFLQTIRERPFGVLTPASAIARISSA